MQGRLRKHPWKWRFTVIFGAKIQRVKTKHQSYASRGRLSDRNQPGASVGIRKMSPEAEVWKLKEKILWDCIASRDPIRSASGPNGYHDQQSTNKKLLCHSGNKSLKNHPTAQPQSVRNNNPPVPVFSWVHSKIVEGWSRWTFGLVPRVSKKKFLRMGSFERAVTKKDLVQ